MRGPGELLLNIIAAPRILTTAALCSQNNPGQLAAADARLRAFVADGPGHVVAALPAAGTLPPDSPCPRAARRVVRQARYQRSRHLRDRGDLAVHMGGGRHRRAQRQPLHQKPQIGGDPRCPPVGPPDSAQASQSADPFGIPAEGVHQRLACGCVAQ